MTMRTYAGLLLLQDLFNYIPPGLLEITNLANFVFSPNLVISEVDCGTTLGTFETVNYNAQGYTELSTGLIISRERITYLLSNGIYEVATRHTNSCIAPGGICATCYKATFPDKPIPNVNDRVIIPPEYLVASELIPLEVGVSAYVLRTDPATYTKYYVFNDNVFLTPGIDYNISGGMLTLINPAVNTNTVIIHYMINDPSQFLFWLANTYSGSLLGMSPLASSPLPIRSLLLSSLLTENRMQLAQNAILTMAQIPPNYSKYVASIADPLEQALYIISLYIIYSNVIS